MEIAAKTFFGFEQILADEIRKLGGKDVQVGNRVVTYKGDKRLLYESNLWLRTAISILTPVYSFRFKNQDDFKGQLPKIDFGKYMRVADTFAVKGAVNSTHFSHSQYPFLLLKDAVVDYFRDRHDRRPSVDKRRPGFLFDVHISENECTVSLNSSGAPLFQRGYRKQTGEAPLNEAVAAGLILKSGWDQKSNFIDVFCGSGTLVIEAGLMANGIPPNISRKNYAFQRWLDFDQQMWDDIYSKAPGRPKRDLGFNIIGSDTDGEVIKMARNNAKGVPLGKTIEFQVKEFKDQKAPSGGGVLISNPPYGKRFDEENIEELYTDIGDYMKNEMKGYDCWIISSNLEALKQIQLKPTEKQEVFNGSLSCDFRKYAIFDGSLKEHKQKLAKEKN